MEVMEVFLGTPVKGLTVGEFVETWLDVNLALAEDCLHLAVYTPR